MPARDEAACERSGARLARTELTKAQLRLEADLVAIRGVLDTERAAQAAAVMTAKLEAAELRGQLAAAQTDTAKPQKNQNTYR